MTLRNFLAGLAVGGLLAAASTASAQERMDIPQGEAWTHPHSGIVVPAALTGVERTDAIAYSADSLNNSVEFGHDGDHLSIYIYRNTSGGVPVWFEQARHGIVSRDIYRDPTEVGATRSFALPGRETETGLRTVYAMPENAPFKSTGLALFRLGEWYVKVRASSKSREPMALDAWMSEAIGELTLPANLSAGPEVEAVTDCPEPLVFKKEAKDAPSDVGAALISGLLGQIVMDRASEQASEGITPPQVDWCRDVQLGGNQTVYRPNASKDGYLIALGDSGIGISVGRDQSAALLSDRKKPKPRYVATMHFDSEDVTFVAQNRLPSPKRVTQLINAKRVATTVPTWGDEDSIEISSDAM